ncbi:MAG: hypothetical protein K0B11_11815 [Mariniphaga sp.]|nr:hypothetical protein [Mariniphaga sp.]
MDGKDIEIWNNKENPELKNNDFLKETSPFEFYFEELFNGERMCICTNQELVEVNNFCELCNGIINR